MNIYFSIIFQAYRKKVYAEQGRVYDENSSTCEPVKPGPISLSSQVEVPKLPKLLSFLVAVSRLPSSW